ncbi:hypothetical protein GE09DRAFT_1099954 [Coniochaeta sp. 2T2.1]|nr:hypothetical protein GE09DRAFT_1099954 [Coniochaeta sp. 2T2.1]
MLSFPRPAADREVSGKAFYHIVAERWLFGPVVDTGHWFSWILQFEQPQEAAIRDGKAVNAVVAEIEETAAAAGLVPNRREGSAFLDAIFINHDEVDHLHKPSLLTFDPRIQIFAVPAAATKIETWNHFLQVYRYPNLDPSTSDWRALHPRPPLPSWLTVFRLYDNNHDLWATAIIYSPENRKDEAILWVPHSIPMEQPALRAFLTNMEPPIAVKCIMHPLHRSTVLGIIKNSDGVDGGLALARRAKPKYWVKTHHQLLRNTGAFGRLLRDYPGTLESAVEREKKRNKIGRADSGGKELPQLVEVGNGVSFVLDD